MATDYTLPAVQILQQFTQIPAAVARALPAHISGGHAELFRYSQESERNQVFLGYYDPVVPASFDWPALPAGGIVDFTYVKLWMQNALLQYLDSTAITKTSGSSNRVHADTINFAVNGIYARDALLFDRDVKPGDIVKVRGFDSMSNPIMLWTYVQSLVGDPVAADVEVAATDTDNPATQSPSVSVAQISGDINCVTLTADASGYNGLAQGNIVETYDVLVTGGSSNGDFTTAQLRVISGSGNDDVPVLYPEPSSVATEIGLRGLLGTFAVSSSSSCSASATSEAVSAVDLVVGQRFRITVHQSFTEPTPTSGGTYAGPSDTTYIVKVFRGGHYTDTNKPQIIVTTTNGIDLSGPTTVTAASTPVAVGTYGVTIEFSGTALNGNDIYYVDVIAEVAGPMRTLVLGHSLDSGIAGGSDVEITLYILNPLLQIPQNRAGFAPLTNWDVTAEQITVNDGIVAYDPTWTSAGVPMALPVISESSKKYGGLYAEYRAWLNVLAFDLNTITDPGGLDAAISGALTPDNPLKYGVFLALTNANGAPVTFTSVANPDDPDSWADMLGLLVGRVGVYGLVPLTHDQTVIDLCIAHVGAMSSAGDDLFRVLWVNLIDIPTIPVVSAGSTVLGHAAPTTTDGAVCLATIAVDPLVSGTQYLIVRCTSGNSNFLTNGVRGGDVLRTLYTGDGFGGVTYSEFIVNSVTSEDELVLLAGPSAPINVGAKVEVWRNLNATDEATAIAQAAGTYGNARVRAVWPDQIEIGGTLVDGMFLCCALSGESSGILPHQGMTRLPISGFSAVSHTTRKFNRDQLDTMAASGVWIVTQNPAGTIYTRDALTTIPKSVSFDQSKEMIVRNVDSISFRFFETFDPYIGVKNVTPSVTSQMNVDYGKLIETLQSELKTANLGGQLIDATLIFLGPSSTLPDGYVIKADLVVPFAVDTISIYLQI